MTNLKESSSATNIETLKKNSLLPTNDVIFHCLFGTVGNERVTKAFIEKILKTQIEEINLDCNLDLIREHYDDKLGVLDVRARTKSGVNYNIEMQNTTPATLPERILSYWSRIYNGDLKRGDNYDVLSKTIAILIVNGHISKFDEIKKYHTRWNIREEDYTNIILTDDLEIHIIELPKYIKMNKDSNSNNIWLNFILNPNEKGVLDDMKDNKELKEAKDKYEEIISDEKIRDRALRLEIAELDYNTGMKHAKEEGIKEGKQEGIQQGIQSGIHQGIKQIILSMYNKNISPEEIARMTDVDINKVKEIIEKEK